MILKEYGLLIISALLVGVLAVRADNTGTDPAHKYAWGENIGWVNAEPTNYEVMVHYYESTGGWLSGYAWGENIGWIVMGSAGGGPYANTTANNWGVNLTMDGELFGYAWGANVGWINFEQIYGKPVIDSSTGAFSGYAWGENIGWLKFKGTSPDYGVRTMAFDTQTYGTPNWWLNHYNVTELYDAGDGVPAWQKYVMDTDPNVDGDYLRITSVSNSSTETVVSFTPASMQRYYTLTRAENLTTGDWNNVIGEVNVQYGAAGEKTMQDTNALKQVFYSVEVTVEP